MDPAALSLAALREVFGAGWAMEGRAKIIAARGAQARRRARHKRPRATKNYGKAAGQSEPAAIPTFASEGEERRFWDQHDPSSISRSRRMWSYG